MNRRYFLGATASAATVGVVSGCAERDRGDGGPGEGDQSPFYEHLLRAPNFDGTVVDLHGKDEVVVEVGVPTSDGKYGFEPPGIAIDVGTTVRWKWTGNSEKHNVVAMSGAEFESELTADPTYEYRFTVGQQAEIRYWCENHQLQGMVGGILSE